MNHARTAEDKVSQREIYGWGGRVPSLDEYAALMKDRLAKFVNDTLFKFTNFDVQWLGIGLFQNAERDHTPLLAALLFIYKEVHHKHNMTQEAFLSRCHWFVVSTKRNGKLRSLALVCEFTPALPIRRAGWIVWEADRYEGTAQEKWKVVGAVEIANGKKKKSRSVTDPDATASDDTDVILEADDGEYMPPAILDILANPERMDISSVKPDEITALAAKVTTAAASAPAINDPPPPAKISGLSLPPNLASGFGGVDASFPIFSAEAFRPGLFNFDITDPARVSTYSCASSDGRGTDYTVPDYLHFVWQSSSDHFTVAGQTKTEFSQELSMKMHLDIDANDSLGFGMEMSGSFNDESSVETFNKYVARYDQYFVYRVAFKDREDVLSHVSKDAWTNFCNWGAEKIVNHYGTHYMTDVQFGGLRVISATVDTRDEISNSELTASLNLKISMSDPVLHAIDLGTVDTGMDASSTTRSKIAKKMEATRARTVGGLAEDDDKAIGSWRRSLYANPASVNYKIRPLHELMPDDKKAKEVEAAIKKRLKTEMPADDCGILAVRVPIKTCMDYGNLSVAYPDAPKGWLRLCQVAEKGDKSTAFKDQPYGIAVKMNPNLMLNGKCPRPTVVPASSCVMTDVNLDGNGNKKYGLFTLSAQSITTKEDGKGNIVSKDAAGAKDVVHKYMPISEIIDVSHDELDIPYKKYACIREDLLVTLSTAIKTTTMKAVSLHNGIFRQVATGQQFSGSIMGTPISKGNLGDDDDHALVETADGTPGKARTATLVYMNLPGVNYEEFKGMTLDWGKVQWLESNWMLQPEFNMTGGGAGGGMAGH